MKSDSPKVIALQDYQKPNYLIPEVALIFDLYDDYTIVKSTLKIEKNPALENVNETLILKGENLYLKSIKLNGSELEKGRYEVTAEELCIFSMEAQSTLEIEVEIKPHLNKALDGLYLSDRIFCTQNEPHGFRKITYFSDRPDIMSKYRTTLFADKEKYPVLLSNGNPIESGDSEKGRHYAVWEDPFPKPCYLFALVAGKLACVKDEFVTCRQRKIDLRIYTDEGNQHKCGFAMQSLKKAMKWDEDVFGLECDLDIYMIVAVDAFNMGAMENKGLNIFNSQYVLADPTTATDQNYMGIEGVIAHEYFHNWTGNRVTCRDWFQLTLKEGLTVFRDQEFSSDMNSRPVKRIEDVRVLRDYQFAEDAGPNVHPIRPQSYIEVNNFYTSTVYNKGAEVIRMIETLIGKEKFRKGITRYFELYDGQAVTTEDFIYAMHLASGVDFSHFQKWYSQAGTPLCDVDADYDENLKEYRLRFKQTAPKILKEQKCEPFLFPIKTGFIGTEGQALSLKLKGDQKAREEHTLILSEASQEFVFEGVKHKPIPSLLRDFSAPISLVYDYSEEDLSLLMSKDSNSFNRYEAGQRLARRTLNQMIAQCQKGKPFEIASSFTDAFGCLLEKADEDFALTAESMILPSLNSLVAEMPICDFDAAYAAKEFLLKSLAVKYQECLLKIYYECQETGEYRVDFASVGRRSLKNRVLEYLSYLEGEDVITLIAQQLEKATNMTDEIAAFSTLVQIDCPQREMAIETFYQKWYHEPLVMNKWLSVQAFSKRPDVLAQVKNLEKHKIFDINNPNKVRSLIGCFAGNLVRFHDQSGEGYQYLADKIIEINRFNPSIAARLSTSFKLFSKMNKSLKAKMETQLERIMVTDGLSRDVYEMVYNTLTSNKKNETSA